MKFLLLQDQLGAPIMVNMALVKTAQQITFGYPEKDLIGCRLVYSLSDPDDFVIVRGALATIMVDVDLL